MEYTNYALVSGGQVRKAGTLRALAAYLFENNNMSVSLPILTGPGPVNINPFLLYPMEVIAGVASDAVATGGYDYVIKPGVVERRESSRPMTAPELTKRDKLVAEESERQAIKTLPFIKQLRRMQRSEVVDMVQAAFPPGAQRDLVKQLALIAWVTALNNDKNDD